MRRLVCLTLLAFVAACNTPWPQFRGVTSGCVKVAQGAFGVRIAGLWMQAIRLCPEWAPGPAAVVPRAVHALKQVCACRVVPLGRGPAVIVARLDCGAGPPSRPPPAFRCAVAKLGKGEADPVCQTYAA